MATSNWNYCCINYIINNTEEKIKTFLLRSGEKKIKEIYKEKQSAIPPSARLTFLLPTCILAFPVNWSGLPSSLLRGNSNSIS
jgi:hypothetical protein